MVTVEDLQLAYSDVELLTDEVCKYGMNYEKAKADLKKLVLIATFEGRIQGKNEEERKAVAANMFKDEQSNVELLEVDCLVRSNYLALARIHLDFIRDCIRLEELAKK